ncbi:Methyl-accepting chemotaxis protein (plasmid) [Nostoc flagelliforme CCNUN1]|uniref:Methyl-accepting chemotaxis protein n=1 Tax=Nostoc flagelliforme CCNUN1 TaxID=2038116 RepID=A0A2K8T797_9NOSO|nr:Methyl-accepting chemotaxis protein [Nostoc flagelliforme CCNUN1]
MIPRKQIVIKKLLVKFPQWGVACVDGDLDPNTFTRCLIEAGDFNP